MEGIRREHASYFESSSFNRVQILILALSILLGIALRFYGLDDLGPWSDELASLYFAENPGLIFIEETHPPLFYLYLKIFTSLFGPDVFLLRFMVAFTGLGLVAWSINLASKIMSKNEVIVFSVLILLCQAEIVHTRMIRQYAILFDLSLILFLLANSKKKQYFLKFLISFFLAGIHPLGFMIPLSLVVDEIIGFKRWTQNVTVYLFSLIPVLIYYISKIYSPSNAFTQGYSGKEKVNYFIHDIFLAFAGEHYPKLNVAPVSQVALILISVLIITILLKGGRDYFKNCSPNPFFRQSIILIFISVLFIEIFSETISNIRVGRYLIYLLAPLTLSFVTSFKNQNWIIIPVFAIQLVILTIIKPLYTYPSEREAVSFFKRMQIQNPAIGVVLCANRFQYSYYLKSKHEHCIDQFEKLKSEGKDFVFVDLNGFGRSVLPMITRDYSLNELTSYGLSITAIAKSKK